MLGKLPIKEVSMENEDEKILNSFFDNVIPLPEFDVHGRYICYIYADENGKCRLRKIESDVFFKNPFETSNLAQTK